MKIFFTIFFTSILFFNCEKSYSQDHDPIDATLNKCLSENPTTYGMRDCIAGALSAYDKEMNNVYQKLLSMLNETDQEVLRESQREWIKFRDKEYVTIESIYQNFDGTMYLPMKDLSRMDLTKHRVYELKSYYSLFEME